MNRPAADLPATPSTFRAVARSSPWLWSTVDFVLTRGGSRWECRVRRPDHARAVDERGEVFESTEKLGAGRGFFPVVTPGDGCSPPEYRWAQDTTPPLDEHGLVARAEREFTVHYDAPMIQDYQFVALLDPVELADGAPSDADAERAYADGVSPPIPDGCELTRVREEDRHGRRTWWATAVPTDAYCPRCSCCALLSGRVSSRLVALESGAAAPPDAGGATSFLVGLDVDTGICVSVTPLDCDDGSGFDVEILRMDDPTPP